MFCPFVQSTPTTRYQTVEDLFRCPPVTGDTENDGSNVFHFRQKELIRRLILDPTLDELLFIKITYQKETDTNRSNKR